MDKNEAIKIIRSNYPTGRNQLCEALETLIPELKESEDKEKPNGGIVLEDFNEGDGFYKVNLAYLSKEQVEEIENIVKKWNPELKESKDEKIKKAISDILLIDSDEIREIFDANNVLMQDIDNWLEKQGEQKPANYSVWVGGSEVNDNYLTKEEAEKLASKYRKDGYEDVAIEKIEQKPAWSEEDEEIIKCLNNCLDELEEKNGWHYVYVNYKNVELNKIRNWLKSLKERMKGE